MKSVLYVVPVLASLGLLLAACGNDSPTRGAAVSAPTAAVTTTKATIDAAGTSSGAIALTGAALCDVKVSALQYNTLGGRNEETTATTAIMVPSGTNAACTGSRPILLYAHGTSTDKNYDMASPSNGEAGLAMAMYAAQGFIVVAPNYTGYKGSALPYHPYLNASAQAIDMIDALRAAKASLTSLGAAASSKLFISGYSQGGFVAMATHREIQTSYANEFTVSGSGPMSGPLSLDKFSTVIYAGTVNGGASIFTPLIVDSYQNSYGNVYTRASDVYQSPFDTTAVGLLPNTDLAATAKLPAFLFDQGNGSPFLIKTSFRTDFQSNPANGLRIAGKKNDLLGWKPAAPVAICYGANDPVVFGFNSSDSVASIRALGGNASVFNLEDAQTIPNSIKAGFDAQKAGIKAAAGGGAAGDGAVLQNYHSPLVPPYCNVLVREFFRGLL
jgi:poly(3-hydroxybutyrate) depolymerase